MSTNRYTQLWPFDLSCQVRFVALTNPNALKEGEELEIRLRGDTAARQVVIEDTGIGMSREDLLSSLGTIARSGTAKFAQVFYQLF